MESTDFKVASQKLLTDVQSLLPDWLPGGRFKGKYYLCADINGGMGNSFSVNTMTGEWKDFATGEKGGRDLVALYATIRGIKNGEAYRELGFNGQSAVAVAPPPVPPPKKEDPEIIPPPATNTAPDMTHPTLGMPDKCWTYHTPSGDIWHYVCRWDTQYGKEIRPLCYSRRWDKWIWKSRENDRPLYNLHKLAENSELPVLIVEGEKAADAAEKFAGDVYVVTTWSHGSSSMRCTDWSPLDGRKILMWPDDDEPGRKAEAVVREILLGNVEEYKFLKGYGTTGDDAADFTGGWSGFAVWARRNIEHVGNPLPAPPPAKEPDEIIPPERPVPEHTHNEDTGDVEPPARYGTNPYAPIWEGIGMKGSGRSPHTNLSNAIKALSSEEYFGGAIWYDTFHQKVFTDRVFEDGDVTPRPWGNIDDLRCAEWLQNKVGMYKISDEMVAKAVAAAAHKNKTSEPRDWMESLEWDGEERIEHMLFVIFGADDNPYTRAVSKNFWISMVARVLDPGCQVDNMLQLVGKEGIRKTTAMRIIGDRWYGEAKEDIQSKDFYLCLRGKILVEIGELNSFSKKLIPVVKQVVSCRTDTYRAPYERRSEDHPRSCVFVGTTNERELHDSDTGMRRFWPVYCRRVDVKALKELRDQMYAEAVAKYKDKQTWHETPDGATRAIQEEYRRVDAWENIVTDYASGKDEVTLEMVWTESALQGDLNKFGKREQMRIATALKANGYVKKDVRRFNSKGDKVKVRMYILDKQDGDSRHEE